MVVPWTPLPVHDYWSVVTDERPNGCGSRLTRSAALMLMHGVRLVSQRILGQFLGDRLGLVHQPVRLMMEVSSSPARVALQVTDGQQRLSWN